MAIRNKIIGLALAGMSIPALALAGTVQWYLQGVVLEDSTIVTGTYTYDADTTTFSAWDILTQPGSLAGRQYTPGNAPASFGDASDVHFAGPDPVPGTLSDHIWFILTGNMTNAGGTIAMNTAISNPVNGEFVHNFAIDDYVAIRGVIAGEVTTSPIPEPATYLLLTTGLLGFGWRKRRQTA